MSRSSALVVALLLAAGALSCGGDSSGSTGAPDLRGAAVRVVAGDGQSATVGTSLPAAVVAQVTDARGAPVARQRLVWSERSGGTVSSDTTLTDAAGKAAVTWTLGTRAGPAELSATLAAAPTVQAVAHATVIPGPPVQLFVSMTELHFSSLLDTLHVDATVADAYHNVIPDAAAAWESTDTAVATVEPSSGLVVARGNGSATLEVAVAGMRAALPVTVAQRVAALRLRPLNLIVPQSEPFRMDVLATDARGQRVVGAPLQWTSSDPGVATADATGALQLGATGTATIGVSAGTVQASTRLVVAPGGPALTADRIASGSEFSCALTAGGRAACWGWDAFAQLGTGSVTSNGRLQPAFVNTAATFTDIAAGHWFACGLTAAGAAYCWGDNSSGQIGVPQTIYCTAYNTQPCEPTPRPLGGGLAFTAITAGQVHACGLTAAGAAYCWGSNALGQLGLGTTDAEMHLTPVPAAGGRAFTAISAGWDFTCGLAADGTAYCWGRNDLRQLGGTGGGGTPVQVPGVPPLVALRAGPRHACGLTAAGEAYCWGYNGFGEIGNGQQQPGVGLPPTRVGGGLAFREIAPSLGFTCAIATDGTAHCWGYNGNGVLGDGTDQNATSPVAVFGGHAFVALSAAGDHACALDATRVVYCWGAGQFGELGTGARDFSAIPVRVAQP